jgi:hypothetical protein
VWLDFDDRGISLFLAAVNSQRRLLVTLGLYRRAKDITPDLQDYLAANHPATVTTDEDDGE